MDKLNEDSLNMRVVNKGSLYTHNRDKVSAEAESTTAPVWL